MVTELDLNRMIIKYFNRYAVASLYYIQSSVHHTVTLAKKVAIQKYKKSLDRLELYSIRDTCGKETRRNASHRAAGHDRKRAGEARLSSYSVSKFAKILKNREPSTV